MDRETMNKVLQFRKLFSEFPKPLQKREFSRLDRILQDKKPITVTPIGSEEGFQFNSVKDLLNWLRANGYPKANNSNIYKSLNNTRPSAYGHIIKYKDDDQG